MTKNERIDAKIRSLAIERLPYTTAIGTCMYLFLAILHSIMLPDVMRDIMAPLAAVSAVFLFFLRWFITKSGIFRESWAYPASVITFLTFVVNSIAHLHYSGEIYQTTNLMLCLLGCSMFINKFSIGLVANCLVLAAWWLVVIPMAVQESFWHFVVGMVTAALTGAAFLYGNWGQTKLIAKNEVSLEDRGLLLKALSDATDDALVIVKDGKIIGGNGKLLELASLDQARMEGMSLKDLFPANAWDPVSRFLQSSESGLFETEIKGTNGSVIPMAIRFKTSRISDTPVMSVSFRGFTHDHSGDSSDSTIRTLASGVAHEINNPLTIISGHIALIQRLMRGNAGEFSAKLAPSVDVIQTSLGRVTKTVSSLMKLSSSATAELRPVTVDEVLATALSMTKQRFLDSGVMIHTVNAASAVLVPSRGQEITTTVIALLENSLDAVRSQKDPEIAINAVSDGDQVLIRVIDSGPPIADQVVIKLFAPFFSTKPPGQGQGLALSLAKKKIAEHGGSLEYVQNAVKTTFEIKLPVWTGRV